MSEKHVFDRNDQKILKKHPRYRDQFTPKHRLFRICADIIPTKTNWKFSHKTLKKSDFRMAR
tara:strand:+ start:1468 stop:1653 length:186 start_codon:yes stop_codon:yes gene_type:complete